MAAPALFGPLRRAAAAAVLLALPLLTAAACGAPPIDLVAGLEVQDVSTGWLDAGASFGNNKLVPKVSFKLRNVSGKTLAMLQVNALFRRVGRDEEWGSGFMTAAGSDGLSTGAATRVLTLRSPLGYTGTDPVPTMLVNSHFVDAQVDLFAKYGSAQWTRLGRYPILRQLSPR